MTQSQYHPLPTVTTYFPKINLQVMFPSPSWSSNAVVLQQTKLFTLLPYPSYMPSPSRRSVAAPYPPYSVVTCRDVRAVPSCCCWEDVRLAFPSAAAGNGFSFITQPTGAIGKCLRRAAALHFLPRCKLKVRPVRCFTSERIMGMHIGRMFHLHKLNEFILNLGFCVHTKVFKGI
jgi:hypothetical protein